MTTKVKLGPGDQGRALSFEEFVSSDFEGGHKYELIHGRLCVSPLPNPPANDLEDWLLGQLKAYAILHPKAINKVTNKARVYVEGHDEVSYPEPDISAYRKYPRRRVHHWREVSPILVVEVIDSDNPEKDTVRNRDVYLAVPSIKEYWILDSREDIDQPNLLVHRRRGPSWRILEVPFGGTYAPRLLPGFRLVVDPSVEWTGE